MAAPQAWAAGCSEPAPPAPAASNPAPGADPRAPLRTLALGAIERNSGIAAARLIAEAALDDLRESQAAKQLQASFNASGGPAGSRAAGNTETSAAQLRAGVTVSQLLYDGGRTDRLIDVRRLQGEALRLSHVSQQEQLALSTVSAAFELSRYRQQAQVYAEYRYSAACLVDALEQVVAADRGRLSELVQARKTLLQVELTQSQTDAVLRQSEIRLRRFVGELRLEPAALAAVLLQTPALTQLQADAERASEIAQLQAQAEAADALTQSIQASTRPQLSWNAGLNRSSATGGSLPTSHGSALSAGLSLSIPLLSPGTDAAVAAARKRAQAAALQRDDALDARKSRIADMHDQARSAFERARLTDSILRDSERLRGFTMQQWQQLGRRSLFDVMAAESDHFGLRIAQVNALHDGQQLNATLQSLGRGLLDWLQN
ncbi:TolC family protein [Aquabacterium sp.]|uniref:TolC family protein n=1 Tax=Aquabacterium sp. TaxID=1872578 RepID=UPI002CEEB43D|nr:TolC family protein [Aquabacterium sp.]HSW05209.1 TolC family protein [Aquabacterium sp.]